MKWKSKPDDGTVRSAVATATWLKKYRKEWLADTEFKCSLSCLRDSKVWKISAAKLASLNWSNGRGFLFRLRSKTPAQAYPVRFRHRGQRDLDSVAFHMSTTKKISPILAIIVGGKYVLLDGVHRLVAAHLLGAAVHLAVVRLS